MLIYNYFKNHKIYWYASQCHVEKIDPLLILLSKFYFISRAVAEERPYSDG